MVLDAVLHGQDGRVVGDGLDGELEAGVQAGRHRHLHPLAGVRLGRAHQRGHSVAAMQYSAALLNQDGYIINLLCCIHSY